MGGVPYMDANIDPFLDRIFTLAEQRGLDLDFHVDETADPKAETLKHIAETAIRLKFAGQITVGHCCSLARQDASEADRTLDLVAEAGIAVVSLPMCNMYLQDRHAGRTPRWRGVTLLHEMAARGIPVSVASDNTRDPFYAYGDLDCVEVFREAVRIAHLDHPFGDWPRIVTTTPADVMRLPQHGRLAVGAAADLVVFRARRWSELLARPQSDRTVIRAGRTIDQTLPDYRELDDIVH
jgi:cytosine deaminase